MLDPLVNTGIGLTTTVTFCPGELLQPLAVVTYLYMTEMGLAVELVNASFGLALPPPVDPEVGPAGVIPAIAARVHAKVDPVVALVGV
jgi:hypothetical protein